MTIFIEILSRPREKFIRIGFILVCFIIVAPTYRISHAGSDRECSVDLVITRKESDLVNAQEFRFSGDEISRLTSIRQIYNEGGCGARREYRAPMSKVAELFYIGEKKYSLNRYTILALRNESMGSRWGDGKDIYKELIDKLNNDGSLQEDFEKIKFFLYKEGNIRLAIVNGLYGGDPVYISCAGITCGFSYNYKNKIIISNVIFFHNVNNMDSMLSPVNKEEMYNFVSNFIYYFVSSCRYC